MKIFKEKELVNEIKILDLGIVQAGEEKEFIFYAFNETDAEIYDIKYSIKPLTDATEEYQQTASEVRIIEAPNNLMPNDVGEIKLLWKSSITIKRGLKAELHADAKELWS
ncbi:MAG: hypothetical protein ACTSPD_09780 [Promethearchaeota archaeon]